MRREEEKESGEEGWSLEQKRGPTDASFSLLVRWKHYLVIVTEGGKDLTLLRFSPLSLPIAVEGG